MTIKYENVYDAIFTESELAQRVSALEMQLAEANEIIKNNL